MAATRATGATAFLIKLNNLFFMTSSKLHHPQMHASGRSQGFESARTLRKEPLLRRTSMVRWHHQLRASGSEMGVPEPPRSVATLAIFSSKMKSSWSNAADSQRPVVAWFGANQSKRRRCGLTLRHCPTSIRAELGWNARGVVVSGKDEFRSLGESPAS